MGPEQCRNVCFMIVTNTGYMERADRVLSIYSLQLKEDSYYLIVITDSTVYRR